MESIYSNPLFEGELITSKNEGIILIGENSPSLFTPLTEEQRIQKLNAIISEINQSEIYKGKQDDDYIAGKKISWLILIFHIKVWTHLILSKIIILHATGHYKLLFYDLLYSSYPVRVGGGFCVEHNQVLRRIILSYQLFCN